MDDHTRLARKLKRSPTALLRGDEVKTLVSDARRILGPEFSVLLTDRPVLFEDLVRWGSLKARCEQARTARQISIKTAAVQVGIPQYRIVAIESGTLRELVPKLAWKYFDFLGVDAWVKKWVAANLELASRAGLAAVRGARNSNRRVIPAVRSVTPRAAARVAPPRLSGYARR